MVWCSRHHLNVAVTPFTIVWWSPRSIFSLKTKIPVRIFNIWLLDKYGRQEKSWALTDVLMLVNWQRIFSDEAVYDRIHGNEVVLKKMKISHIIIIKIIKSHGRWSKGRCWYTHCWGLQGVSHPCWPLSWAVNRQPWWHSASTHMQPRQAEANKQSMYTHVYVHAHGKGSKQDLWSSNKKKTKIRFVCLFVFKVIRTRLLYQVRLGWGEGGLSSQK